MMQANWSLVLNILLLVGVVIAIGRMMKSRRQQLNLVNYQPSVGVPDMAAHQDDIIAVRKVHREFIVTEPEQEVLSHSSVRQESFGVERPVSPELKPIRVTDDHKEKEVGSKQGASVMLFLLAKENRQLAGYELLQTILASGLRFGEGHLFHRHQSPNGKGPILFSLAAATASGTFDLQNIGAFTVHGLCLFMHVSGNATIDADRFSIMLDTANQLSEGLDCYVLDDQRHPLTEAGIERYHRSMGISELCEAVC